MFISKFANWAFLRSRRCACVATASYEAGLEQAWLDRVDAIVDQMAQHGGLNGGAVLNSLIERRQTWGDVGRGWNVVETNNGQIFRHID